MMKRMMRDEDDDDDEDGDEDEDEEDDAVHDICTSLLLLT